MLGGATFLTLACLLGTSTLAVAASKSAPGPTFELGVDNSDVQISWTGNGRQRLDGNEGAAMQAEPEGAMWYGGSLKVEVILRSEGGKNMDKAEKITVSTLYSPSCLDLLQYSRRMIGGRLTVISAM